MNPMLIKRPNQILIIIIIGFIYLFKFPTISSGIDGDIIIGSSDRKVRIVFNGGVKLTEGRLIQLLRTENFPDEKNLSDKGVIVSGLHMNVYGRTMQPLSFIDSGLIEATDSFNLILTSFLKDYHFQLIKNFISSSNGNIPAGSLKLFGHYSGENWQEIETIVNLAEKENGDFVEYYFRRMRGDNGMITYNLTNLYETFAFVLVKNTENVQPTAIDSRTVAFPNQPTTLNLKPLVTDPDTYDLALFTVNQQPEHGIVKISSSGSAEYTPKVDYLGDDHFVYSVSDGFGGTAQGTVNLKVTYATSETHPNEEFYYHETQSLVSFASLKHPESTGFLWTVSQSENPPYETFDQWDEFGTYTEENAVAIPKDRLTEGSNYFHVISMKDGEILNGPTRFRINIQKEKPSVTSLYHPSSSQAYSKTNAKFSWNSIPGMTYYFKRDQNPYTIPTAADEIAATNPLTIRGLIGPGEGFDYTTHYFHLVARDQQGLYGPATHVQFNIGKENSVVAPRISVSSSTHPNPELWYNRSNPTFTFSGAEGGYLSLLDQKAETDVEESTSIVIRDSDTVTLPQVSEAGRYYLHFRGYGANNETLTSDLSHFPVQIIGKTEFQIQTPHLGDRKDLRNVRFQWTHPLVSDLSANFPRYYVVWDQNPDTIPEVTEENKVEGTNSYLAIDVTEGIHYLHLRAEDTAGNLSEATSHLAVNIGSIKDDSQLFTGQGQAIIVAGGGATEDNYLWRATNALSRQAYRTFKKRGLTDENIYLFHPLGGIDLDSNGVVDRIVDDYDPTVNDLDEQIQRFQEVSEETGPLYLYLVDHGTPDKIQLKPTNSLGPQQILTSSQLDEMLDAFQEATQRSVIVILEACYSGTFLEPLKADNRIIMASTDSNVVYLGDNGEISYSSFLFNSLLRGGSLRESHNYSKNRLKRSGRPFNQARPQISIGNLDLFVGGKVVVADFSPEMVQYTQAKKYSSQQALDLSVNFSYLQPSQKVWATITPPDFQETNANNYDSFETPQILLPRVSLSQKSPESLEFTGQYSDMKLNGNYTIQFFSKAPDQPLIMSEPVTVSIEDGEDVTVKKDYQAELLAGWNLFSPKQVLSVESIEDQLASLLLPYGNTDLEDNTLQSVWRWDPIDQNWQVWSPLWSVESFNQTNNTTLKSLTSLQPGQGYWLQMKSSATPNLGETDYAGGMPELQKGWNLIGFGENEEGPIEGVIDQLSGYTIHSIWTWDRGEWVVYPQDLAEKANYASLSIIEQGKGYWLLVK